MQRANLTDLMFRAVSSFQSLLAQLIEWWSCRRGGEERWGDAEVRVRRGCSHGGPPACDAGPWVI